MGAHDQVVILSWVSLAERAATLSRMVAALGSGGSIRVGLDQAGQPVNVESLLRVLGGLALLPPEQWPRVQLDRSMPACLARQFRFGHADADGTQGLHVHVRHPVCNGCRVGEPRRCAGFRGESTPAAERTLGQKLKALCVSVPLSDIHPEAIAFRLGLRQALRTTGTPPSLGDRRAVVRSYPRPVQMIPGGQIREAAEGETLTYVARSREVAEDLLRLEHATLHPPPGRTSMVAEERRMGELFGYPACCTQAYTDVYGAYSAAELQHRDYLHLATAARGPAPASFLLNPSFPRPALLWLVSHVPCSFNCAASRAIARAVVREAGRLNPFAPLVVAYLLRSAAVVWPDGTTLCFKALRRDGEYFHYQHFLAPLTADRLALLSGDTFAWPNPGAPLQVWSAGVPAGQVALDASGHAGQAPLVLDFTQGCP